MSVGVIGLLGAGYWIYNNTGPSIRRTEVVTILSVDAGWKSRRGPGIFRHHVRFASGAEGNLTFDTLYSPGELVKVHYARNLRWGWARVFLHSPCDAACAAAYPAPPDAKAANVPQEPIS
jgi:hypothetical protein